MAVKLLLTVNPGSAAISGLAKNKQENIPGGGVARKVPEISKVTEVSDQLKFVILIAALAPPANDPNSEMATVIARALVVTV